MGFNSAFKGLKDAVSIRSCYTASNCVQCLETVRQVAVVMSQVK